MLLMEYFKITCYLVHQKSPLNPIKSQLIPVKNSTLSAIRTSIRINITLPSMFSKRSLPFATSDHAESFSCTPSTIANPAKLVRT